MSTALRALKAVPLLFWTTISLLPCLVAVHPSASPTHMFPAAVTELTGSQEINTEHLLVVTDHMDHAYSP